MYFIATNGTIYVVPSPIKNQWGPVDSTHVKGVQAAIEWETGSAQYVLPYDMPYVCDHPQITCGPGVLDWSIFVTRQSESPSTPVASSYVFADDLIQRSNQTWTWGPQTASLQAGHNVTLKSVFNADSTIIEGAGGAGWQGLTFNATASGSLTNATVRDVDDVGNAAIHIDGSAPSIENTTITALTSGTDGIHITGSDTDPSPLLVDNVVDRILVERDISVPSGEEWSLLAGDVLFDPNKDLTVHGTLDADGTSFSATDPAQGWYGIRYEDGSDGTLMGGAKIRRVSGWTGTAVTITDASPVLDSLFIDTPRAGAVVTGVRITGSDAYPTLNKVQINGMTYDGIVLDGAALARLTDNFVTNTTGEGLQAGFNTETFLYPALDGLRIRGNEFETNTGDGFRATDGTHSFGYYYYPQGGYHNHGYNSFDSNDDRGVEAGYGVTVHAGASTYVQKDRNRLVDNGDADAYADAATIYAECDWWGITSPPFNTAAVNGGLVDDSHWLLQDPYVTSNPTCTTSSSKTGSTYDALRDVQAEDPALALVALQSIVTTGGPEAVAAVRELAVLGTRGDAASTRAGVQALLEATATSGAPDLRDAARYALVRVHHRAGDLDGALAQADALAADAASPGASVAAHRARVYVLADLGRDAQARSALSVLEGLAPESAEMEMARLRVADLTGETAMDPNAATVDSPATTPTKTGRATQEALHLGVRPNPASGMVSLDVILPDAAEAEVTVHDVLGREVVAPLSGALSAGHHAATVDASRLAPGVYLVRASIRIEGAAPEVRVERLTVVR